MRVLRTRLTYANVIATLALFLALGGSAVWAASKIGSGQLKANAVTAGKIKKNAVTLAKIKNGAVNFSKLANKTNLIGTATGGPVTVNTETAISIPLTGTTSVTPKSGVLNLLHIEARAVNLAQSGAKDCAVLVQPIVNGQLLEISSGFLFLAADTGVASAVRPIFVDSESGPLGLSQPGVKQEVTMRVLGDADCTATSQVTVALAITQDK